MPSKPKVFRPSWMPSPEESRRQYDRNRGNYRERGYSKQWDELKAWLVQLPEFALCVECSQAGECTDHIVAMTYDNRTKQYGFKWAHLQQLVERFELGDPYQAFLNPANLQRLCRNCHSAKTARFDGTGGHRPDTSASGLAKIEAMLVQAKARAQAITQRMIGGQ
jgi:5-methylcytosine-specific restriction endonuclease McrA